MTAVGHISPGADLVEQIPHPQGPDEEIQEAIEEVRRGERVSLAVVHGMEVVWITPDNVDQYGPPQGDQNVIEEPSKTAWQNLTADDLEE